MKVFTLSSLTLALFLFSCGKHNEDSPVIPPPVVGTININLATEPIPFNFLELIISESSGGKVLLDTLGPIGSSLVASLRTDQTLFDYTWIRYNVFTSRYDIDTYKAVNLSNWSQLAEVDYSSPIPLPPADGRDALLLYTNVPLLNAGTLFWSNNAGRGGSDLVSESPNTLGLSYSQFGPSDYMYFLMSGTGLYNFHIPKGITDTVDLSHMDTAVSLNFNKPAGYTITHLALIGIMDTTDLGRSVFLYGTAPPGQPDIEYPRKLVQQYELFVDGNDGKHNFNYYSYGGDIPTALPIPDASSAYTISASQNTNFSVKFGSARPSRYTTIWTNAAIHFSLNSSPDSTTLNPVGLLTSLNSTLLKGQTLSTLTAFEFDYLSAQGFNYQDLYSYIHNKGLIRTRRVPVSVRLAQGFR